jgi:hypothetical protein
MGLFDQGLLGMGGLGGMSGNAKQQALLGSAFDPQEQKRQMLKQGLLGAGIAMLGDGNIASGMKGGLEGAYGAQQGYMQNAKTAMEMNAQKTKQAQEERQQAAIMQWIDGLPPDQQEYAHAFPEQAAQEYANTLYPSPPKFESYTLGEGQIRYGADNKPVAQGPAKTATPTDDMREFGFAQNNPAFSDYMLRMKKAGATNIDIAGADGNFDKELSKGVAGAYVKQMETGQNAVATKTAAQQLRVLMKGRGGSLDGLTAATAPYLPPGLVPEGASDVVAAQAIIAGLVPKQRVPGSGTTSDFDARKFAESLPNLWNKPGANEIITNTMESYADYQITVSNVIADVASNPDIKNKAAAIREQVAKIPDPFMGWKQYMGASGSGASNPVVDDLVNKYRSK